MPKWGDGEAVLQAVDMIAHCRGFGQMMAQGSKRISQWVGQGSDAYLVEVKGLELAMHDPRTKVAPRPRIRGGAGRCRPHDERP